MEDPHLRPEQVEGAVQAALCTPQPGADKKRKTHGSERALAAGMGSESDGGSIDFG